MKTLTVSLGVPAVMNGSVKLLHRNELRSRSAGDVSAPIQLLKLPGYPNSAPRIRVLITPTLAGGLCNDHPDHQKSIFCCYHQFHFNIKLTLFMKKNPCLEKIFVLEH